MWALLALTGLNLLNYLDRQVLPAVLTPLKADLHLTDSELGTVASAFMLGYFVTSPFFGWLGDRVSRKWLIMAGVAVWSIGTFCSGIAGTLTSLIMFRVLVGLGEASYGTISPAWIADLYPTEKRNNALSIFYVAIPVGSALGYIIGGLIAAHYGWRHAFFWAGGPGLLLAFLILGLREPERGASDAKAVRIEEAGVRPQSTSYFALVKNGPYVRVVLGYVAQTFALGAFSYWGPTFLQRVHGMSLESANRFFGGSLVLTGLTATLLGGQCATAWKRRSASGYAWVLGLSALLAAPVSFAAFLLPDAGMARVALVAAMFFLFLPTGPVNTLILETVPVLARARAMAASIFAIHFFGDLWSPKIVGMLSDHFGSLQRAVLLLPGALVLCALFWLSLIGSRRAESR